MTKNLQKQIKAYAGVAGLLLAADKTNGQVVYVDINPDTVLSAYGINTIENFYLDLNGDTANDFRFLAERFIYSGSNSVSFIVNGLLVINFTNNAVLGECQQPPFCSSTGSNWVPKRLNQGDTISPNTWHNASAEGLYSVYSSTGWFYALGNWVPLSDNYMGLKFKISGQDHYGWIHIEVTNKNEMILKGYAYQSQPNIGLRGGDTATVITAISSAQEQYQNPIAIFSESQIVKIHSLIALKNATAAVYDLLGKEIFNKSFTGNETSFTIDKKGIYFVEVKSEKGISRKKVFIY
ncbi:MAG TPA: T9SS type A sorting domain-containing protein [Bacteroidia bacterium]|nr:T9SS type A sorting domain-containing protein [Bacteroidia bacterium]